MRCTLIILLLLGAQVTLADEALRIDAAIQLSLTSDAGPTLRVDATWDRIVEGRYNLHRQYPRAFAYSPAEATREMTASDFGAFLPREPVAVGDVWRLQQRDFIPILQQFHPGATTRLRWGEEGAYGCLRAVSERYAELTFRVHGELELVPKEVYLTPGQFTGHLLIDRKEQRVVSFSFHVPDRNTNADVNAYRSADIVYIPRMELAGGDATLRDAVPWQDETSEAEAAERLARSFYAFEAIEWVDLETAIARAPPEGKPLHVVILFGVLDDESC